MVPQFVIQVFPVLEKQIGLREKQVIPDITHLHQTPTPTMALYDP